MNSVEQLIGLLESSSSAAAFTGAGVSTLSGIRDFRGSKGVYRDADGEKMFDRSWFDRDPSCYYRNARELIYQIHQKQPSLVHCVLADLEKRGMLPGGVITQNIDMLHEKAGSRKIMELHGTPAEHSCVDCSAVYSYEDILPVTSQGNVPRCRQCGGVVKPGIVFFGEELPQDQLSMAFHTAAKADLLLVLGSSLVVHPAASIPVHTLDNGGKIVIVNQMPTPLDDYAVLRFSNLESVFDKIARYLERKEGSDTDF